MIPEYEMIPEHTVNAKRVFTFERADTVVDFAKASRLPVQGRMSIRHFVKRKWLFEDADGHPLPREETLQNLEFYITGVVSLHKGRVEAWNVVKRMSQ